MKSPKNEANWLDEAESIAEIIEKNHPEIWKLALLFASGEQDEPKTSGND